MNEPTTKLPEKMGELLALAVDDYDACREDPHYKIVMGTWHTGGYRAKPSSTASDYKCEVCLAGTVIAKSFGEDWTRTTSPDGLYDRYAITEEDRRRLEALDDLRTGNVRKAWATIHSAPMMAAPTDVQDFHEREWDEGPQYYYTRERADDYAHDLRDLADRLKLAGL